MANLHSMDDGNGLELTFASQTSSGSSGSSRESNENFDEEILDLS